MNNNEESREKLKNAVIASAISDILAIRIFNAQRERNIRIAFFFYYRKLRRSYAYNHLTNQELRIKIIGMLCKRLKKINFFLQETETMFAYTEQHGKMLHRVKTMSIIEIGKLKRQGVIFTKIELRSKQIIIL